MNYYIALGLKVFVSIIILIQTVLIIGYSINELDDWIEYDEQFNGISIIITLFLYCITIPFGVWIFNL